MSHVLLHLLGETPDLQVSLAVRLAAYGFTVDGKLRAWRSVKITAVTADVGYTDGYRFHRVPLHDGKTGITVLPHRFFFVGDRAEPTSVPLNSLPGPCAKLPPLPPQGRIEACAGLLMACGTDPWLCAPHPLSPEVELSLHDAFGLGSGPLHSRADQEAVMRQGRSKPESLHRPPGRTRWMVLSRVLPPAAIASYAATLRSSLQRGRHDSIEVVPLPSPPDDSGIVTLASDSCIVLLGVAGAKGTPLDPATAALLVVLDAARIPFRLFADASRANRFAPTDQISHLITLAGGLPHQVGLGPGSAGRAFIGVDLGHPPHLPDRSRVVVTWVKASGELLGYWTGGQRRDERLQADSLQAGVAWLREHLLPQHPEVQSCVVLRDGRIFPGERLVEVFSQLPIPVTVVECIKHPVPFLVSNRAPAAPGTYLRFGDQTGGIAFMQPPSSPVAHHLANALKLRFASNPQQLTLDSIGQFIFGLCYAPMLGLRASSSPAPIYWADGLAGLSPTNHQFSGLHHVVHN